MGGGYASRSGLFLCPRLCLSSCSCPVDCPFLCFRGPALVLGSVCCWGYQVMVPLLHVFLTRLLVVPPLFPPFSLLLAWLLSLLPFPLLPCGLCLGFGLGSSSCCGFGLCGGFGSCFIFLSFLLLPSIRRARGFPCFQIKWDNMNSIWSKLSVVKPLLKYRDQPSPPLSHWFERLQLLRFYLKGMGHSD